MKALSNEELRSVKLRNQNMRQMIYKEVESHRFSESEVAITLNFSLKVKRPGKNHSQLFAMLLELKGPRQIRRQYIGEVILEAKR